MTGWAFSCDYKELSLFLTSLPLAFCFIPANSRRDITWYLHLKRSWSAVNFKRSNTCELRKALTLTEKTTWKNKSIKICIMWSKIYPHYNFYIQRKYYSLFIYFFLIDLIFLVSFHSRRKNKGPDFMLDNSSPQTFSL